MTDFHGTMVRKIMIPPPTLLFCLSIHKMFHTHLSPVCPAKRKNIICQLLAIQVAAGILRVALPPHRKNIDDPAQGDKNHRGMKTGKNGGVRDKLFVSGGVPQSSPPTKTIRGEQLCLHPLV